ncbi:bacterio-opsin activator domain-containing protein [Halarchaeum salinum]
METRLMTTSSPTERTPDALGNAPLYQTLVHEAADPVVVLAPDGTVVDASDDVCTVFGRDADALRGEPFAALLPDSTPGEGYERLRDRAVDPDESVAWGDASLTVCTDHGTTSLLVDTHAFTVEGTQYIAAVCRVSEPASVAARERHRLREERDQIERVDTLVRDLTRAVVDADDRSEIERVACERLIESDPYAFAWLGRPRLASATVEPAAWAGSGPGSPEGYLDVAEVTTDDSATGRGPAARALDTTDVTTVADVSDAPRFGPWREAALDHGFRSAAAIPVALEGTVYGVLCLYATETRAFDGLSDTLRDIGRIVANAIRSSEQRKLLYADTLLELELRVASDSPLVAMTANTDCTLTLDGIVPKGGLSTLYVDVDGCAPDRALDALDDTAAHTRVIRERDDGGLVEVSLSDGGVVPILADAGARVDSAVAANGEVHFVVQTAPDTDVRGLVDHVRRLHPNADLVSKREIERQPDAFTDVRDDVLDDLTDRQYTALRTAYHAGYLEWPRESSGEDLAETMGVSPPTFYQHLRAGERKLFDAFFD